MEASWDTVDSCSGAGVKVDCEFREHGVRSFIDIT